MLPREASEEYSKALVEKALLNFPKRITDPVWSRAEDLYNEKLKKAKQSMVERKVRGAIKAVRRPGRSEWSHMLFICKMLIGF